MQQWLSTFGCLGRSGRSHGRGGRSRKGGASGRACTGALKSQLIGSRGMGPWDHGAMGP